MRLIRRLFLCQNQAKTVRNSFRASKLLHSLSSDLNDRYLNGGRLRRIEFQYRSTFKKAGLFTGVLAAANQPFSEKQLLRFKH